MRTYRELLRAPEFTPLFTGSSLQVAGLTVSGLALGTLVYVATGSPLLSALSMFGSSFSQLVGAALLMSAADRLPPRAAMAGVALALCLSTAVLALPGLSVAAMLGIVLAQGLVVSVGSGVRYGLLSEVLPGEGYRLGRSVLNMAVGTMQICGFGAGGVLLTALSPRGALLVAAALYLAAAVVIRAGLTARTPRAAGRPSIAVTVRTNAALLSSAPRRYVYLALWVPNGLIVGCESLFIPYAPGHAGLLFAFAAFGMLVGDTLVGRFAPRGWRMGFGLLLLLAAPYLIFVTHPPLPLAAGTVMVASVGYAASLLFQERLVGLLPAGMHGQALGLHSTGMLAVQGICATLAGVVAQLGSPATAMAAMAVASMTVTGLLSRGLRLPAPSPHRV